MKTKILLIVASIMVIPAVFTYLINLIAALEYWQDKPCSEIITSKLNHEFVVWVTFIGFLSFVPILTAMMTLFRYGNKLDRLEEVEINYNNAVKEMQIARDKYTELLLKSK